MRAILPHYSPLVLVELGRLDGGLSGGAVAPSKLPWRPHIASTMRLDVGGSAQTYEAVAAIYNDGSHWWSDMLSPAHRKRAKGADGNQRPLGAGSYRYDGLEADGLLQYVGPATRGIILTSDERHVSIVVYRRASSSHTTPTGSGAATGTADA